MYKRARMTFWSMVCMFSLLAARIGFISRDRNIISVGVGQGSRTVTVATVRGTIYDRNLVPLVNTQKEYKVAMVPEEPLLRRIQSQMSQESYRNILKTIGSGAPIVTTVSEPVAITAGLRAFMVPKRYNEPNLCCHLIGHLQNDGTAGATGIELALDEELKQYGGEIKATFSVDGMGAYQQGTEISVSDTTKQGQGGVVLTIDRDIQHTVEELAVQYIQKGAVAVIDTQNGELLAGVSLPTYSPDRIEHYLDDSEKALLNRITALYDCGSVFKIVTAAAALESGYSPSYSLECSGFLAIDGSKIQCHQRLGHQQLDMMTAFAHSCNLYFVQLALELGPAKLLETARKLGFSEEIELAKSMIAPESSVPDEKELFDPVELANFSIGQGKLMATPLHIAQMTSVIACKGTIRHITLVKGLISPNGEQTIYSDREGETVLSRNTVLALNEMMKKVVSDGTGQGAQSETVSLAGKTGTAQTGQYRDDRRVTQHWFTGYFPADDPRFVITILAEDAEYTEAKVQQFACELSNNLMQKQRDRN